MNETRKIKKGKRKKRFIDWVSINGIGYHILWQRRPFCWARLILGSLTESPLAQRPISFLLRREGIDFFFESCWFTCTIHRIRRNTTPDRNIYSRSIRLPRCIAKERKEELNGIVGEWSINRRNGKESVEEQSSLQPLPITHKQTNTTWRFQIKKEGKKQTQ